MRHPRSRLFTIVGGLALWGAAAAVTILFVTMAAAATTNLDQCANGSPSPSLNCNWQNGNLNSSNAEYEEGDSIPYRLFIEGLDPSVSHTIHVNYDFTMGGVKAIDFLTTWNVTQTTADPCSGSASVPSLCPPGGVSTFAFPGDPYELSDKGSLTVDDAIAAAGVSRNLTIYNGTIKSISTAAHSGTDTANSDVDMTMTFNANACVGDG